MAIANHNWLITATLSGSFLAGSILTLLESSWSTIREQLQLQEREQFRLTSCFTGVLMLMMLVSGLLVDKWGAQSILILGSLLAGFSIACLGVSKNMRGVLAAAALLATAGAMLHTASAVVMPWAFLPSGFLRPGEMPPQTPAATNFGYLFVALGVLLMPFLTSRLLRQFQFRNGLLILALVALVPAVLSTLAGEGNFPAPPDAANLFELLQDYRLWLAILAFFFFFALEMALLRWPSPYLADLGFRGKYRAALLFGFWLCFLATRFWSTQLSGYLAAVWWLLLLTILTAVLIGNMSGIYHSTSGSICFLLLGGALGPIFPTLVGLLFLIFADQPATAFGLVCALGTAGRLLAWPLIQTPLQRQQVRVAMWITAVIALLISAPALALVLSWGS